MAPASKSVIADSNGQVIMPGPIATNGQRETVSAPAIAAGALSLDLSAASVFNVALNANVTTLTFANMVAGFATSFVLQFTADGTPRTVTQPGSVVLLSGAYVPCSTNGKRDLLTYTTLNGGTTWLMGIISQNY